MEGLIVNEPYASMIINREKKWELRSRIPPEDKIGKELFLLSKGKVLGIVSIKDTVGPLDYKDLKNSYEYHKSYVDNNYDDFQLYAWEIQVHDKFTEKVKYDHPTGARVWVKAVNLTAGIYQDRITNYA